MVVQLPNNDKIDIKDLFVEINGQNLSEFKNEIRIYFGKAWFNQKESGYSVVFDKTLTSAETTKQPSTFLPLAKLVESGFVRFNLNTLQKISDEKPKMTFLLSKTAPCVKKGYINIWCEGPEYLDYRL